MTRSNTKRKRMTRRSIGNACAYTNDTSAFTTTLYPLYSSKEMSDRRDKREKKRRRREPSSSSESSSSSSSSEQQPGNSKYLADLEAFLHSAGMTGTANERTIEPRVKKGKEKEKPKKDKEREKAPARHTTPTVAPAKSTSGIPLPMSAVHLPRSGGLLASPDPPSVAK
jgi:hypothetical protein